MSEFWLSIPGYGGHYEASSHGRIRVLDRVIVKPHSLSGKPVTCKYKGKVLSPSKDNKWGHLKVTLGVDGKDYPSAVHRLVLLAFVGPCPDGMEACHNNGIAWDNRPENLRWDTHAANNRDRKAHGTYATGERHPMAKVSDAAVQEAFASGAKTNGDLMRALGISRSQAQRIRKGQSRVNATIRNLMEAA